VCEHLAPLTTAGKPHAVRGALGARLGTTRRTDGKLEVTYNGHPLYHYAGDTKPGDTKGQNLNQFGGGWYVLSPFGKKIESGGS
jgi:predicted lipoprotein with Yx(FWY)xxD motif